MTNEQKYKTAEERREAFFEFCDKQLCTECRFRDREYPALGCSFNWLADEYKEPKPDLPFIVKTEVRNGCQVSTICSFDGKEVISGGNVIGDDKAYCDSLNAVALAWHERMNKKDAK